MKKNPYLVVMAILICLFCNIKPGLSQENIKFNNSIVIKNSYILKTHLVDPNALRESGIAFNKLIIKNKAGITVGYSFWRNSIFRDIKQNSALSEYSENKAGNKFGMRDYKFVDVGLLLNLFSYHTALISISPSAFYSWGQNSILDYDFIPSDDILHSHSEKSHKIGFSCVLNAEIGIIKHRISIGADLAIRDYPKYNYNYNKALVILNTGMHAKFNF